jgi:hypothetical protein
MGDRRRPKLNEMMMLKVWKFQSSNATRYIYASRSGSVLQAVSKNRRRNEQTAQTRRCHHTTRLLTTSFSSTPTCSTPLYTLRRSQPSLSRTRTLYLSPPPLLWLKYAWQLPHLSYHVTAILTLSSKLPTSRASSRAIISPMAAPPAATLAPRPALSRCSLTRAA